MTCVDDMKEQIGFDYFLESRAKRGHQIVRKFPDKANGVGEKHARVFREMNVPRERIERREQSVLDENRFRAGKRFENRRFTGVRVAYQRCAELSLSCCPSNLSRLLNVCEPLLQETNAMIDETPVCLQLSLAGTSHSNTAPEFLEVSPHPHEARQHVL